MKSSTVIFRSQIVGCKDMFNYLGLPNYLWLYSSILSTFDRTIFFPLGPEASIFGSLFSKSKILDADTLAWEASGAAQMARPRMKAVSTTEVYALQENNNIDASKACFWRGIRNFGVIFVTACHNLGCIANSGSQRYAHHLITSQHVS